jgi:hypothetical protein
MFVLSIGITNKADATERNKLTLPQISRMMYVDGNNAFLLVELLQGGYIQEGLPYRIAYDRVSMTVNGTKVAEKEAKHYLLLLAHQEGADSIGGTGNWSGDFTVAEHFDSTGTLKPQGHTSRQESFQQIGNMMVEDGLAGDGTAITIQITKGEVSVNGHLLTTPLELIYKRHIMALSGYKNTKEGGSFDLLIKRSK